MLRRPDRRALRLLPALFAGVLRAHLADGGSALIATHVDLGLPEAGVLDLSDFRAQSRSRGGAFDEAFA